MKLIDEKNIVKEIKKPNSNCYYFYGEDDYLIESYSKLLIKNLEIDIQDAFNYHEYQSPESLYDIINTIYTLPVFKKTRAIIIKNLSLTIIEQKEISDFKEVFSNYPEETILIIINFSQKLIKEDREIANLFDKTGMVIQIKNRSQKDIEGWISGYLKKNNCETSKENIRKIVKQSSNELGVIKLNLDKLIAYQKNGLINNKIISKLIAPSLETSIFLLSRSINNGNYNDAILIANDFKNRGEEPVMVFNTLYSYYNDVLRAKSALNEGVGESRIKDDFMYRGREFVIRNSLRDSKRMSWTFLEAVIDSLFTSDIQIKKSSTDSFLLLEVLITKIFLLKQKYN